MAFSDGVHLEKLGSPLEYQWAFLLMAYIYRNTITTYQPTDLGLFCLFVFKYLKKIYFSLF